MFNIDQQVIGWAQSSCHYYSLVTSNGYPDALSKEGGATKPVPETPADTPAEPPTEPIPAETEAEEKKEGDDVAQLSNSFDTEEKQLVDEDKEKKDSIFPTEDIKEEFQKMMESCGSLWCRGGLVISLILICCLGCLVGRCCCSCGRRSKKANYQRAEVELNGSFTMDGKTYRDDPVDDEYGEFEMK